MMTKEQALALTEHIQRETPRIQATFDDSQARNGRGYQVKLHLAQREFSVNYLGEWESIQYAWHWLLYGEDAHLEVPPLPGKPSPAPRYLVDGQEMRIRQVRTRQKVYWIGAYQEGGKTKQRYFGKQDPRPNYPLVEEVSSGTA